MGYPSSGGDASTMRCAIDGGEADCNSLYKFFIRRNIYDYVSLIITKRFSETVTSNRAVLVPGGSHGGTVVYGTAGPGGSISSVEIIGDPDYFEISSTLDITLNFDQIAKKGMIIPRIKNATPDQQNRFNDGYTEFWNRIHENDGDNPCAKLFGGVKNVEEALKKTDYSFERTKAGAVAEVDGKKIKIDPNGSFMSKNESEIFMVGVDRRARIGSYIALNNVEAAAFILAHEIGHLTGKLQPDGHDPSNFLSILNNGVVQKACFNDVPVVDKSLPADVR